MKKYNENNSPGRKYTAYADDFAVSHLTSYHQYFLLANELHEFSYRISGFLGLGDTKQNSFKNSFVRTLWEQKLISSPLFSLTLQNPQNKKPDSVISFGDYDFKKFSNDDKITIKSDEEWSFLVTSFNIDLVTESKRDTPTFFTPSINSILFPPTEHKIFFEKVEKDFKCRIANWNKIIRCKCLSADNISSFPKLTFKIDGNSYIINPES